MANKPCIAGIGPGNPDYLCPGAKRIIEEADVLIGGRRNLEDFAELNKETLCIDRSLKTIVDYIAENYETRSIVVLASGDTGLFSISSYLRKKLPRVDFNVLPGISSLQHLMAKKDLKWNEMKIVTLHGNDDLNLKNTVARNKVTAIFTGGKNTPATIAATLNDPVFPELTLTVGENLSYPDERVISGTPEEIAAMDFGDLSIVIAENPDGGEGVWPYLTPGLPDSCFLRDEVPMTKSEIRALIMSKLQLRADSKILEIGAGSGSCTVEMGLLAYEGKVCTIEKNPTATELCKKNIARFGLDNITVLQGNAPEDLPDEFVPDRLFIGGSGGNMGSIIKKYAVSPLRIVISAITVESVSEALEALKENGFENIEIIQAAVARSRKAGTKHLMMGLNPITVISGERR